MQEYLGVRTTSYFCYYSYCGYYGRNSHNSRNRIAIIDIIAIIAAVLVGEVLTIAILDIMVPRLFLVGLEAVGLATGPCKRVYKALCIKPSPFPNSANSPMTMNGRVTEIASYLPRQRSRS